LRPCARLRAGLQRPGRLPGLALLLALAASSASAAAASVTVTVMRPDGRPISGAVVMLHGPPGSKAALPTRYVVDQVDLIFTPDLTVIPVGSSVNFPNSDAVSHQVYSFSPAKRFQLPLYRGAPYAPVRFEEPGVVTLGCNIHDEMIAYLVVTDAEWHGRTEANGSWIASNLPAGDFRVEIWHPRMREGTAAVERRLTLDASAAARLDVRLTRPLRPEPLGRKPRSWSDY